MTLQSRVYLNTPHPQGKVKVKTSRLTRQARPVPRPEPSQVKPSQSPLPPAPVDTKSNLPDRSGGKKGYSLTSRSRFRFYAFSCTFNFYFSSRKHGIWIGWGMGREKKPNFTKRAATCMHARGILLASVREHARRRRRTSLRLVFRRSWAGVSC